MKYSLIILFFFASQILSAQCAMCKAVVESGAMEEAEGLNNGIIYLMIFPYLLVGVFLYYIIKSRKVTKL